MARTGKQRGARVRSGAIGALVFAGIGFSVYVALNAQTGVLPFTPLQFRTVAFDDVGDLQVGNEVRVAQVRIGRVDDIDLVGDEAHVRMQIDDTEYEIYRDATAEVTSRSGLGQQYLDLRPGSAAAGRLGEDDVLPADNTENADQLLDLAEVFDPTTQAAAQTAIGELGNGAAGRGEDLRDFFTGAPEILPDLGTVARSLAVDDGRDLTTMLESLDGLTARFSGREQEIADLVGQLDTTLAAFDADGGAPLAATLDVAPESLSALRTALVDLQQPLRDTTSAMSVLEPGAGALGDATPDLRGVLTEAPGPLDRVPGVSDLAEPALSDLTPVFTDARPVAPKLTELVASAHTPLQVLAPYAPEIAQWFTNARNALSDGDTAGHALRFTLIPRDESVTGAAGIPAPLTSGDAYPEPGEVPGQTQRGGVLDALGGGS